MVFRTHDTTGHWPTKMKPMTQDVVTYKYTAKYITSMQTIKNNTMIACACSDNTCTRNVLIGERVKHTRNYRV